MAKVKIYTTPTCTYCKQAKEYFKEEGHTANFTLCPIIRDAPKIISDKSNIHAKALAAGKPNPDNMPVIPAGFISLLNPIIRKSSPKVTLNNATLNALLAIFCFCPPKI